MHEWPSAGAKAVVSSAQRGPPARVHHPPSRRAGGPVDVIGPQGGRRRQRQTGTIMTKTYSEVLEQIESLKARAETLRRQEVDAVIATIREQIAQYGLTAADLGLVAAKPRTRKRKIVVAKYRDEAGNTWVGRGKRPQWVRDALASGKTLQDLELKP
jgi:DNA-binding protein H-NS